MAINFPNSPSNGATHTAAGQTFTYDGTVWNPQKGTPVSTGTSAPSSPSPGDLWFDTSDGTLYFYYADGSSNQWVGVSGPAGPAGESATTTTYAAVANLPSSGNTIGSFAYITSTNQLAVARSATAWSIFNFDATTETATIEYLIVAGGGGGGSGDGAGDADGGSGGGGAGGVLTASSLSLSDLVFVDFFCHMRKVHIMQGMITRIMAMIGISHNFQKLNPST